MKNYIAVMFRKLRQKRLLKQAIEFLADPNYNTGDKVANREWLLKFIECSSAREARHISFSELKKFTECVMKHESSEYRRMEAAKVVRKFFKYCILRKWVSVIPDEELKPITKDDKIEFMNKMIKGWRRGPMPNKEMVKRVRYLHNTCKKSFRDIVAILEKETGKRQYLPTIYGWYSTKKA